jgi:serine/threonine protein phosphatase PrpC
MGAYLDAPKTEKEVDKGSNEICSWGACEMQGWRVNIEDAHLAIRVDLAKGEKGMIFAVFDGHGGKEVAIFAAEKYKETLTNNANFKNGKYKEALEQSFYDLDEAVGVQEYAMDTGCTSNVVLITPD